MTASPNIVWVTMESTRADHTTLEGHHRDTTPNLQRIANRPRGQSFDQCFSHGIWTLSSSASILTGVYPSRHGTGMQNDRIPDQLETVPERLQSVGYRTGCISPNSHLSAATGLDRGFDDFAWISRSNLLETVGPSIVLRYLMNIRRHGGGFTTNTLKHGTGFMLHELAKRWLQSYGGSDEPFFLYAHYGDPHHPYYPPLPYLREFAEGLAMSPAEAGRAALRHHDELNERIAHGCDFTESEWQAIRALYDGGIAYTDHLIGDLFDYVESLDIGETIFVVTADHGELLGEQGMLAHKVVVDDAVCHVPLVTHGVDGIESTRTEMVQHADLMRTLVAMADGKTDRLHGIDLREETRQHSIVQRGEKRFQKNIDRFSELNPTFDTSSYHPGTLHAIRTSRYKYLSSSGRSALHELPDEEADVAADNPEIAADLDERLSQWLEKKGRPVSAESMSADFTDEMEQQLADLGYL